MMDNGVKSKVIVKCRDLVDRLLDGTLATTPGHPYLGRLRPEHVKTALSEYPGIPTRVPDEALQDIEAVPVVITIQPRWLLHLDLWFDNKKSDLTAIISAEQKENGDVSVALNDIRVM